MTAPATPLIRAEGLSREFQVGRARLRALDAADLEVRSGEFVAVTGPSGSGKSTLLGLIGLLDAPTGGRLFLAGRDVTALSADVRARLRNRHIGFVFQSFNLLPRATALENVELPMLYSGAPAAERRRRAADALGEVGLAGRADHWPAQLSGGEQQRVAIARAIVNRPDLILADEPTGALDSATGDRIMALLAALNDRGRTVVVVTHDPAVAGRARRVIRMLDGAIASGLGTPALAAARC